MEMQYIHICICTYTYVFYLLSMKFVGKWVEPENIMGNKLSP